MLCKITISQGAKASVDFVLRSYLKMGMYMYPGSVKTEYKWVKYISILRSLEKRSWWSSKGMLMNPSLFQKTLLDFKLL